jgi:hypothetical protein
LLRHLLRLLPVLVLAGVGVFALTAASPAKAKERSVHHARLHPADGGLVRQIRHYRRVTWRWQSVMGVSHTRATRAATKDPSHRFKVWVRNLWKHRAKHAHRRAAHPPHLAGWLCIHRYEGAWTDGGGPYYGGLQMDLGFQRTYGARLLRRKGTADNWSPLEQMWVAERAHHSGRGYYAWPNTARYCGLI